MLLKEITERNYAATVRRGFITPDTMFVEFGAKISEELDELWESFNKISDKMFDETEIADIILVCLAMSKHYNIDIQKALEEKTLYNESRKD